MKHKLVVIGMMALLFAGMCVIENSAVKARPKARGAAVSSIYALAGEFRTVFANLLWIKADEYHHEFILHQKDWARNKELIGLLNLIIMLDPQFEDAYANLAYIYADGCNNNKRGLSILRHGVSNNPKSRALHELVAVFYARRLNQPNRALPYARKAVTLAEDSWYRTRSARLLRTIEGMASERQP